jgi:23S rRNA (guanosine2251-2'-O)-methyltransferase
MTKRSNTQTGELLYGAHPIIEALKAKQRKIISIYTTRIVPKSWKRIEKHLPKRSINIQYVDKPVLEKMARTPDHMGVVAWFSPFQFRRNMFSPEREPRILLLDSVQDVRNLGAILRSAYCTNYDGVVICKSKSAPLTAAAIKSSAGLAEHMPVYVASSAKTALNEIKQLGYNIYVAALGGKDVNQINFYSPSCLVIGNEERGVSKDVLNMGTKVTLPQKEHETSYNASVAAGILMFLTSYGKK